MKRPPAYILIDETLELRLLSEQDAPAIFQLIDANRSYLREWLPWVDSTKTIEDERFFIRIARTHIDEGRSLTCSIWYQGQVAGTIGFHPYDWSNRKVEIGYWLGAQFQGHGIITRTCQAMIRYAFEELQLNKVEIRCATGNIRSCAIPQRLGFTYEGTSRQAEWLYDHYVDLKLFGLLANEWRKREERM